VEQNQFTTKHHAMYSRIRHIEKSALDRPVTYRKLSEDFNSGGYAAKTVVELDFASKSYSENVLLNEVCLNILRNDRIALIGANGCGKSTLIRLIMGEEPCDSGVVKVSSNIKIAYMPQIILFDDENATVIEALRNAVDLPEDKLRSILVRFNFNSQDIIKKVSSLSGGEKSRLKLCLLMQSQVNFLILDEPTNHLDIESREWIEDAVADFSGTMLFISHDRFFLSRFASKIWSMKDGEITAFNGGFEDFLQAASIPINQAITSTPKKKKGKLSVKTKEKPKIPIPLETQIYKAEAELAALNEEITACLSGMHGRAASVAYGQSNSEYTKMNLFYQNKEQLEKHIASLYDDWANESENGGL